ncbi:MFS transporter [Brachybacterium massiliense]|uniref:MFS transporter n=1 Tax=Brachybacterium massiliense TaxID=1755098 RepID=UPI000B3BCFA8|nr:MFS transporter [Brachybacterium massiliense]
MNTSVPPSDPAALGPHQIPDTSAAAAEGLIDSTATSVVEEPSSNEPPRVGLWFIAVYMLTYFGFNLTMLSPTLFSVAYKIQLIDPAGRDTSLGLVLGLGGIFGLVAGPVFGVLSDGTRLRWGRRRPWLLGGMVLALVGGIIVGLAPIVPIVLFGFAVMQLGIAGMSAGFNPVLAEHVPTYQRGKVGALGGAAAALAGISAYTLGSQLTGHVLLLFVLPVAVFAVGLVLFFVTVPDRPASGNERVQSVREIFASFLFNPLKYPDFAWVWLGKAMLQFGFTFFSTYQLYFMLSRLGYTAEEAAGLIAIVGGLSVFATMSFAILSGVLSDRLRRRKPFIYIASALIAGGLVTAAFAPDFLVFAIGGTMLAAGTGAFTSVDLALATDLLPEKEKAGKYMAIYYLSSSLPGTLAPLVAPAILAIGAGSNYPLLFVFGALLALGAMVTTWRIRAAR